MLSIAVTTFGQNNDQKNKLSFHSFSITLLEVYDGNNYTVGGGAITGDLSFASGKSIFTFSGSVGQSFYTLGFVFNAFQQLNILYGREFKLNDWFLLTLMLELGFYFIMNQEIGFFLIVPVQNISKKLEFH